MTASGKNLDGDLATELRVFRPVDLSHTAFTQLGSDFEMGQRRVNQVERFYTKAMTGYSFLVICNESPVIGTPHLVSVVGGSLGSSASVAVFIMG